MLENIKTGYNVFCEKNLYLRVIIQKLIHCTYWGICSTDITELSNEMNKAGKTSEEQHEIHTYIRGHLKRNSEIADAISS